MSDKHDHAERIPDKAFTELPHRKRTLHEISILARTYLGSQLLILGTHFP
jgi:hypothetical protein